MGWNGLQRNKLDYILTDLLPVELSELYSLKSFYDFLLQKENNDVLKKIIRETKKNKAENEMMFKKGWDTKPLKYQILKGSSSYRNMSVLQPLSILNVYIFIELYQKEIINYFSKKHVFSLRYHKVNSELYYKKRTKKTIGYFHEQSIRSGKSVIQQLGTYFKTVPFESINAFTGSLTWRMINFNYEYYAQIDYKSCFDSIYSHSFKWITERNTVDSINANNSSLFVTIDRIMQNINGKSSNGLVVGPEFSRTVAEILLQHIDKAVEIKLFNDDIIFGKDYTAYRYVDDIFIFGKSQLIVDKVVMIFSNEAKNYLLQLNELKITKGKTPCLPKEWLTKTRDISRNLNDWFHSKKVYDSLDSDKMYIVKDDFFSIDRIKDEITVVIKTFDNDKRTIVSYLISTLFNNISRKKDGCKLFSSVSVGRAMMLLDMAFFIYSFYPSYELTRKIISMIVYINNEIDFKRNITANKKLNNLINRYNFIFNEVNIFDLIDWFAFLYEYKLYLDVKVEYAILEYAKRINDPIIYGNILIYSQYNKKYFDEVKNIVDSVLEFELDNITSNNKMLNKEFWFALIFHNCPHISKKNVDKIDEIFLAIRPKKMEFPSDQALNLICDYVNQFDFNGTKTMESFFNWSGSLGIGEKIAFRTYQRTLFKKYNRKNGYYTSLD